jgi:hypothetical protein
MAEFGFIMPKQKIIVDDLRIRGIGKTDIPDDPALPYSDILPQAEKVR